MAKTKKPLLAANDASVTPFGDVHIFFDCSPEGNLFADKELKFGQLKNLAVGAGNLIKISTTAGKIDVVHVGTDSSHTTLIKLTKDPNPDELHIRIPIGVNFFKLKDLPKEAKDQGYQQAFYYYTGPGYNIHPLFLPLVPGSGQFVKELVLIASQVPPRRSSVSDDDTKVVPELTAAEFAAAQKTSVLQAKRPERVTS
jgi:hypothetical protein